MTTDVYDPALAGEWRDVFSAEAVKLDASSSVTLHAWQYRVLESAP